MLNFTNWIRIFTNRNYYYLFLIRCIGKIKGNNINVVSQFCLKSMTPPIYSCFYPDFYTAP